MRSSWIIAAVAAVAAIGLIGRASAQDVQEAERLMFAYADTFNKQDAAGLAAYQRGVLSGPSAIEEYLQTLFKAGSNHEEVTVDQVSPLGADVVLVRGEYHITGQGQNGAMKIDGNWGAVNVREGGALKIRLIMALPKPTPK
jgi:ketosteroid isomerase-like protein